MCHFIMPQLSCLLSKRASLELKIPAQNNLFLTLPVSSECALDYMLNKFFNIILVDFQNFKKSRLQVCA